MEKDEDIKFAEVPEWIISLRITEFEWWFETPALCDTTLGSHLCALQSWP